MKMKCKWKRTSWKSRSPADASGQSEDRTVNFLAQDRILYCNDTPTLSNTHLRSRGAFEVLQDRITVVSSPVRLAVIFRTTRPTPLERQEQVHPVTYPTAAQYSGPLSMKGTSTRRYGQPRSWA